MYHLYQRNGWTESIYTHTSARINGTEFLLNPFGVNFFEVTASSLVKCNLDGDVVDNGSMNKGCNDAGFNLHSAIMKTKPEIKCAIHLHPKDAVAVSVMRCGLIPCSQDALFLGPVSYHDYEGLVNDKSEQEGFVDDWKPESKVMFLRSHGVLIVGTSIEEAFYYLAFCIRACEIQVKLMQSAGLENIVLPTEKAMKKYHDEVHKGTQNLNRGGPPMASSMMGESEWKCWMRVLERDGLKTGQV